MENKLIKKSQIDSYKTKSVLVRVNESSTGEYLDIIEGERLTTKL